MKFVDYYKILEIESSADQITIKQAYKRLALKWHPDRNKEDTTKMMQLLNEAKDVLLDYNAKSKYDREYSKYKEYKSAKDSNYKATSEAWGGFSEEDIGGQEDNFNSRNKRESNEYDSYYEDEPYWREYTDIGYNFSDLILVQIIKKIRNKIWNVAKETYYISEAGVNAGKEEIRDWFSSFWGYLLIIGIVLSIIMAVLK